MQDSNAAETAARKERLWNEDAKPDEMLLQIDMRNAFGSVDRRKMLAEVKTHCPCLFLYAVACCRNANVLIGDGCVLESTRGVQQGDVLGPALFAIVLQPVVERLRELNLELHLYQCAKVGLKSATLRWYWAPRLSRPISGLRARKVSCQKDFDASSWARGPLSAKNFI